MNAKIGFGKTVPMDFDRAVQRVTEELRKEGFGVLTEIDVAATLQSKLGVHSASSFPRTGSSARACARWLHK